jgi:surface carbohydrate biosynthesis protein (TIGR04326 family)
VNSRSQNNSNSLLIWDVNVKPLTGYDHTALWQDFTVDETYETSIPQLVEDNADFLRAKYLAFIYELGELQIGKRQVKDQLKIYQNFSYWWMTLLVEKCNYSKSPQIDNIIKLMAFKKWLAVQNYSTIYLVTSNSELIEALVLLTNKLNISFNYRKFKSKKKQNGLLRRVYLRLPNIAKSLVWLTNYLIVRWPLKGVGIKGWRSSYGSIAFVSYFINFDKHSLKEGYFKSAYWPELPKLLERNKLQSNWLHIYIKSDLIQTASKAKRILQKFNESSNGMQNHVVIESFLSFNIVYRAIKNYYKLTLLKKTFENNFEERCEYLWPLIKSDLRESLTGVVALSNLLNYELFNKAFSILPTQKKGFYLQENQGWEFGLINVWRNTGHKDELVGVPHTTVSFWDLRYFFDPRSYINDYNLPLPDYIGVNGLAARNSYINGKYPEKYLIDLEALRYLYLTKSKKVNSHQITSEKDRLLLVLGDSLPENTKIQMNLLKNAVKNVKIRLNYLVKPHPACPIISDDYPDFKFEVSNEPLSSLIDSCALVYTSNRTSAAVDAYYLGKVVITAVDTSKLNFSPLRESENTLFVSKSNELTDILNNFDNLKVGFGSQREDYFYLDLKLPRWELLLTA